MKTKTPKARVMWANYETLASHPRCFCTASDCHGDNEWTDHARVAIPVAVIPLDDVEALVERAIHAYKSKSVWLDVSIRAALTAAGIPCAKRQQRRAVKLKGRTPSFLLRPV